MTAVLVLLFLIFIFNTIYAELYPIVLFNHTNLENNICYMTNIENKTNHWCELVTSEFILPTIKTCVTINESLSNLDDQTIINEWIDRSIAITNCSYYLLSSMTISQKRILTIVQSILLFILFLPFIFELSLTIIQYCFY
ncbi:unnamed protein product [Rotaria sordida]|uniref:Uncharacterized protein n=1 Tax=Rotaria sordida TaxID=392033 RepID=A0A813S8Y7_9BILA|nr:unnamed protein product [Rotaria sordida]CAF0791869.1 unnamed protein product [Rotaria sordida]